MKCFLPAALLGLALVFSPKSNAQGPQYIPGDIMVMLVDGASTDRIVDDLRTLNGVTTGIHVDTEISPPMRTWLLKFDHSQIAQQVMLRAVAGHRDVQIAQNNHIVTERIVPNDAQYNQQWHHQNIDSEPAWDVTTGGVTATGDTIVVCIIERADLPHPDLIGNAWFNHAEIPNNGIDDDNNGYVDDYRGWNPPNNNDNVYGGSHGTQVAGMIGAKGNNSIGVVGANWDVKMMVVNYGGVQEAQVVAAYTYPLIMRRRYNQTNGAEGAFVVATNASWGIDGGQPSNAPIWCAMYDTLGTAGILSCGATANNNVNIDVVGDLPTACPSDFMVSVTATNINDIRTFSAYGVVNVDVGAPGENVRTTNMGGGYGNTSGTSFASPLTAGVIGLLYSAPCGSLMDLVMADPAAGALYVRDALFDGVEQVGNLLGQTSTGGRINANNSIEIIMNGCGACPAPYNLAAVVLDINSADLSWTSINGVTYDLRYRPVGTPDWTEVNGLSSTSYTASGLLPCVLYEFQVAANCPDNEESDYSASFTWTSEGCCDAPSALVVSGITSTSAVVTWDEILAAGGYDLRYRVVGSPDWTVVTALQAITYDLVDLLECTAYEVQVLSNCDGMMSEWTESTVFNTVGCGACADLPFCPSYSEDASEEWIAGVSIGSINNMSGSDDGYGDYTHLSTSLTIGQNYSITLTPGYADFVYTELFSIWIDIDQDGVFEPNEKVYESTTGVNTAVTVNFTVPASAIAGQARMRIVMKFNTAVDGPCTVDYNYGETEDYCVNLLTTGSGLEETIAGATVTVFPDPADKELFVSVADEVAGGTLVLSILDNSGREVARQNLQGGRNTISTAAYADGLYVYRVMRMEQEIGRGKVIVSHR